MNNGPKETAEFLSTFKASYKNKNSAEVVLAPPFCSLAAAKEGTAGTEIRLSAQNVYYQDNGAYTGEISCRMLKELGVQYVIIGHSERRHVLGEINELINRKTLKVIAEDLIPILCVGEKLDEREAGITEKVVNLQLEKGVQNIPADKIGQIVIAYEPVWAIGTGKNASAKDAEDVSKLIRDILAGLYNRETADKVRILYGGSVKPENITEYMKCSNVDGALVGGASLKPDGFLKLLNY